MINPAKILADIDAAPGNLIAVAKTQLAEMTSEIAIGNEARRRLAIIDSMASMVSNTARLAA